MAKDFYMKSNSTEFADFVNHLTDLSKTGFGAMMTTVQEVAEEGLWTMHDEASMRTQERTGKLLDSFVLGDKYCVYDVGEKDVVFGSALYYAGMVNHGHAIVPPGYKKDYRRQKRRKIENQRYDYWPGAHFFDPAFDKIAKDFEARMANDFGLIVQDTSFLKTQKKRRKKAGTVL